MRLENDHVEVEVDLVHGGRIASLVIGGLSVLVSEGDDPLDWGCYVMAPYAGRVRDARVTFGGAEHSLRAVRGRHALHGTVFDRPWQATGPGRLRADLGPDWPWPGEVEQTLTLSDDRLRSTVTVRSHDGPMPVSVGWHPWFRRSLDRGAEVSLDIRPREAYVVDDDLIPTGEVGPVPPPPWDTPFTGMLHPPRLTWPGALELELTSSAERWVVYSRPANAVCIEPQTARPDALESDDITVVEPGRPLEAWMELRWRALPPG